MSTMDAMLIQNSNQSGCPKSTEFNSTTVGNSLFYINEDGSDVDDDEMRSGNAKRQGTFTALSPNVQKLLSHLPDNDVIPHYPSENNLLNGSVLNLNGSVNGLNGSRLNLNGSRNSVLNRSQRYNKSVDAFSPNVQKIIANLQNGELIINCNGHDTNEVKVDAITPKRPHRQKSVDILKQQESIEGQNFNCLKQSDSVVNGNVKEEKQVCFEKDVSADSFTLNQSFSVPSPSNGNGWNGADNGAATPLGSYLHRSASGIASRSPVGRKNMGKYLQIPSGSTNSSTISSSEVSRPVSLTSLGSSCSSSGSSGMLHQQGSVYLASAESLDSDHEPANISQGSADSGIAESNTTSPELRVLREVLDTETVYVHDLKQVIEGYLEPWRNEPDCPIQDYLKPLFSNLEEIYAFNRSFLHQLKSAACDPTHTANAFLQNDSGFSVYTEYCTDYPRTMEALTALTRDERTAALIRERQRVLGHDLPVGSYLLKPVQRILKYRLLLQRLSKHCLDQHRPTVDLALTTMTAVATHINTMKRKHEHAVRVQEVQSQLRGWEGADVTALGELIAEGTFRVNGARGRRHVFLFEKVLLMTKSRMQDGGQGYTYKSHIMCSNLMLVEQVRGEPLSFHVLPFDNPRLQCTLRARSPQHKREWTLQIKNVIIENYSAVIPNHARQLVMQLGQDDLDETSSNTSTSDHSRTGWSPLGIKQHSHSPPQYLERKTRYRQSRNAFSNRRTSSHDRSFSSLTNWRRKSDPSGGTGAPLTSANGGVLLAAAATLPNATKKDMVRSISGGSGFSQSKFYMDLSDEEEEEEINKEQMDKSEEVEQGTDSVGTEQNSIQTEPKRHPTMEQLVSDLLAHNEELQKKLSKPRRRKQQLPSTTSSNGSATLTPTTPIIDRDMDAVWTKQQLQQQEQASDDSHVPTKADSLPRSFQLNDQLDTVAGRESVDSSLSGGSERTLRDGSGGQEREVSVGMDNSEDIHETDISSQVDDADFPAEEQPTEHKIYRKSPIRHSLLQRFRAILSENERFSNGLSGSKRSVNVSVAAVVKSPTPAHKQGSRSMGAKLANPDYAVPSELLASLSRGQSTTSINTNDIPNYIDDSFTITDEYRLDRSEMTINENEVFEALNERLQFQQQLLETVHKNNSPTSQQIHTNNNESSHQHEDYYEQILDEKLSEEDRRRGVDKSDSFRSENSETIQEETHSIVEKHVKRQVSRPRMLAPPPPIPVKPKFLAQRSQQSSVDQEQSCNGNDNNIVQIIVENNGNGNDSTCSTKDNCNRGWVRTIVNRFE